MLLENREKGDPFGICSGREKAQMLQCVKEEVFIVLGVGQLIGFKIKYVPGQTKGMEQKARAGFEF